MFQLWCDLQRKRSSDAAAPVSSSFPFRIAGTLSSDLCSVRRARASFPTIARCETALGLFPVIPRSRSAQERFSDFVRSFESPEPKTSLTPTLPFVFIRHPRGFECRAVAVFAQLRQFYIWLCVRWLLFNAKRSQWSGEERTMFNCAVTPYLRGCGMPYLRCLHITDFSPNYPSTKESDEDVHTRAACARLLWIRYSN